MEILKFPNPILLKKCSDVTAFGPELKVLLDSMFDTMKAASGIGLAANQVGLDLRMFVMQGVNGERFNIVNPVIESSSQYVSTQREGCLSAPGEFVVTGNRAMWVRLKYQNELGEEKTSTFAGLESVCVQHEVGHLEGLAFIQSSTIPKKVRREICNRWGLKSK